MTSKIIPSCYLIGGDSLLLECATILSEKEFNVLGIISASPKIKLGAQSAGIDFVDLGEDIHSILSSSPFDYLFSITHLEVIDEKIIALPEKLSINFHDGPLPRYAGLNCPVWALINGEAEYGISWHEITPGIDEGDILLQEDFEISSDETSLSLNTKCFAAALRSFPNLLDGLLSSTPSGLPQDLTKRTYFSKFQRITDSCVIDWAMGAEKIEAQIRALDFGQYPNPMGRMKLVVDDDAYIIESALPQETSSIPGEIVRIEEGELTIATSDGSLLISTLKTISGENCSVADFVKKHEVSQGKIFKSIGQSQKQRLSEINHTLCRAEVFWTNRLLNLQPAEFPPSFKCSIENNTRRLQSIDLDVAIESSDTMSVISAFVVMLSRISGKEEIDIFYSSVGLRKEISGFEGFISNSPILRINLDGDDDCSDVYQKVEDELQLVGSKSTWLRDLVSRNPDLYRISELRTNSVVPIGVATESDGSEFVPDANTMATLVVSESTRKARLVFDENQLNVTSMRGVVDGLYRIYTAFQEKSTEKIAKLNLLTEADQTKVVEEWNSTQVKLPEQDCIHQLIQGQTNASPDSVALVFENNQLTYSELDQRANKLAAELVRIGVKPGFLVGIYVERSLDLVVSVLGVLKAGGAYVPLDPAFPAERIEYMINDADLQIILTQQQLISKLPPHDASVLAVDAEALLVAPMLEKCPEISVKGEDLAYVIYTSGSTGRPKGVMVEHRNVVNFFTGMDASIDHNQPGTWLAVTSLSFDISVLELFWTLTKGYKVVIYRDRDRLTGATSSVSASVQAKPMQFGLFMWGNDDAPGREKYRLMLEGAKYFDDNGFDAIWTPERHFHAFGGPYPNPAVTGSAIAAITKNLSIRAGSCVSPLHHPIRIAEDWAVIDNLSNGRVGLGFASGWQPNDFVIKPENHKNNKAVMLEQIEVVRKLWRGEKVAFENPMGDMVDISTLPRPVQKELPVWVTTAGNPETYKQAGTLGANILTHLLGQTLDELAGKIKLYRDARKEAGFDPKSGKVTLMLHTFVGEDGEAVRELVRAPMKDYLESAMKLVMDFAWSFPAFKRPRGADTKVEDVDIKSLSAEEKETILDFAFERYYENSGLFGTPDKCVEMVNNCKKSDIDEIACLLDFGVATDDIMQSLPYLKEVRDATNQFFASDDGLSFQDQVEQHHVTHMQCTPSMARMLLLNSETKKALSSIDHLLVGGEALPFSLAKDLVELENKSLTNMYGPTETTIWSTTHRIEEAANNIPIGRPVANTKVYILDKYRNPTPPGVPGELFIGGRGVVRGYHNRPELTAERFIPNPFGASEEERIYWTGDIACYQENGVIDFLGRVDHQVKVRGYRIELGEIESALDQQSGVHESIVVLREDSPGDQRLVAYYVSSGNAIGPTELKDSLRQLLPDYMVPADLIKLETLPLTPNGKVDRNALPSPMEIQQTLSLQEYAPPDGELEEKIVGLWQNTLKVQKVGANDNFFDLGGHSLLIVRLHSEIQKSIEQPVSLTDLYRFPTIRSLVDYLNSSGSGEAMKKSSDRAQLRKQLSRKRRKRA